MEDSIVLSIIAILMIGYVFWSIKQSIKPAAWPSTIGKIESCSVCRSSRTYQVQVTYRYSVNDKEYINNKLAFCYPGGSQSEQHEILNKLRTAESVRVLYNPNDPQSAVLYYGIHRLTKVLSLFAIMWVSIPVIASTYPWLFSTFVSIVEFIFPSILRVSIVEFTIPIIKFVFLTGMVGLLIMWIYAFRSDRVLLKNLVIY